MRRSNPYLLSRHASRSRHQFPRAQLERKVGARAGSNGLGAPAKERGEERADARHIRGAKLEVHDWSGYRAAHLLPHLTGAVTETDRLSGQFAPPRRSNFM